jgi:hypothetical protein
MQYVLRFWVCEKCGRSNKTTIALDGAVKCEQCADLPRLRSLSRCNASRGSRLFAVLILAFLAAGVAGVVRGQVITEFPIPTAHWDAIFTESLSVSSITKTWKLHVGDSFSDVPTSDQTFGLLLYGP